MHRRRIPVTNESVVPYGCSANDNVRPAKHVKRDRKQDIIAINQDAAGKQAKRIIKTSDWQVFLKELSDGDYALGVLNTGEKENTIDINVKEIGISGKIKAKDLWSKKTFGIRKKISVKAAPHETKVYRLSQQKR